MRVAMISDFVPRRFHFAGDGGNAPDVRATLEKGRAGPMFIQDFEDSGRGFARSVVEREGDGSARVRSSANGRAEYTRRWPADGVSYQPRPTTDRNAYGCRSQAGILSPDHIGKVMFRDDGVGGDEAEAFDLALGDEQAVERIAVSASQSTELKDMNRAN